MEAARWGSSSSRLNPHRPSDQTLNRVTVERVPARAKGQGRVVGARVRQGQGLHWRFRWTVPCLIRRGLASMTVEAARRGSSSPHSALALGPGAHALPPLWDSWQRRPATSGVETSPGEFYFPTVGFQVAGGWVPWVRFP